jgi:hypothetical protein
MRRRIGVSIIPGAITTAKILNYQIAMGFGARSGAPVT